MKKKLVSACLLFAGVIAFAPTDANARPHKHHPSVHRATHAHRVSHHVHRRGKHVTRRARAHVARAGSTARMVWMVAWQSSRHCQPQSLAGTKLGLGRPQCRWASCRGIVVWRNHVGIITGRAGSQWIVKSGNDGNAVRERPRSIAGAIAFRGV